ncbi:putative methyltransferase [Helianthus annuus]|nr:putative methyltransferase [Helianthus annuus]
MPDPASEDCGDIWELLAKSLVDMGLVQESKVHSFNIPQYTPFEDKVKDVIQKEGSFSLHSLNGFALNWPTPGIKTTNFIRAISEPIMVTHFGNSIMDVLFKKYQEHV